MLSPGLRTLVVYLIAGALYVTLGVFVPETILSIYEGIAFLLLMVWLIPLLIPPLR